MAVQELNEIGPQETTVTQEGRRWIRRFMARADSTADTTETVRAYLVAQGYSIGEEAPSDSSLRIVEVRVSQFPDHEYTLFNAEVEYSTNYTSLDFPDDPLDEPAVIRWGFVTSVEPVYEDINGDPIQNSAKQTFDPPIMRAFNDPVVTVTRNESDFDPALAIQYQDTVNSDNFQLNGKVVQAGLARMHSITGEQQFQNGMEFWRVTYEIHFRRDGWSRRIRDEGMYERVGTSLTAIKDANGNIVTSPVLLDGNGRKLTSGDAVYLEWDVYETAVFTNLNLPS